MASRAAFNRRGWVILLVILGIHGNFTKESHWLRAMWIPTVENAMWPSDTTLNSYQQREELINILNAAQKLDIDTVIFQARSHGEAMYSSTLEPWSEYLTGSQGRHPENNWDPLEFLIWQANERKMKVYVWVNFFRANMVSNWHGLAENHVANVLKQHCHRYGPYLWMDPGALEVRQHVKNVIMDIVDRYAIDGVYIDDFYYPPPVRGKHFSDEQSYKDFLNISKVQLSRDSWRRQTVRDFVSEVYNAIKNSKPRVKVALDTFGLYSYSDKTTLKEERSYKGFYTTPTSPKWPPGVNYTIGDFLVPKLSWNLEEVYEDSPDNIEPMLTDWRLEQSAELRRWFSGDGRYRVLDGGWEVFTLCGRETCPKPTEGGRSIRHGRKRHKRQNEEEEDSMSSDDDVEYDEYDGDDIHNEVSFQLYTPKGTHAVPVVGESGEPAPEPDITPDIVKGPVYDTGAWSGELINTTAYVIVHGYRSGPGKTWVKSLKDALLKQKEPHGVIVVDWSTLAGSKWYPKSQRRAIAAADEIARLTKKMLNEGQTSAQNIHCLGHSLGAHTCGLAGKQQKLGRITGLDPAGPNFDIKVPDTRLAVSDASFVDVIHTDVGLGEANAGFEEPLGHADFYPNGFRVKQPGCYLPGCSHKRAPKYYTVSILRDCFKVYHKCPSTSDIPDSCMTKPNGSYFTKMGHHAPSYNETEGIFYLKTRRHNPYCDGNRLISTGLVTLTTLIIMGKLLFN